MSGSFHKEKKSFGGSPKGTGYSLIHTEVQFVKKDGHDRYDHEALRNGVLMAIQH